MPIQLLPEGSLYHIENIGISANSTTVDDTVKEALFLIYQEASDISGTFFLHFEWPVFAYSIQVF
jgi:hypothetical protein